MSKKAWIIFAVIVVGLLGALIISSRNANPPIDVSNVNPNAVQAASAQSGNIADHTFGNVASKVILIEYGDFECPYCGAAYPQVKAITQQYQSQIDFIFRNFPLTSIHPNALAGAGAAEAAGLQGKYWEMHDYLYENQNSWVNLSGSAVTAAFVSYAKSLGLNTAQFTTDLASTAVNKKILFDQAIGNKLNVNSTPTFYLDGVQLGSDVVSDLQTSSGDKLRTLLNADLKKVGVTPPSNT